MAHYDLGNEFYRAWLDDTMSYSAALFSSAADTLETAQVAKYLRILDRLQAQSGERILEIGCGWGGFAAVASQLGLPMTGLTLSPAQLAWAQQRVPEADLRLQDYRDIKEKYDHIVSIEMFEAVGERWWPTYFATIARALQPGGRAVIQTITIRDDLFATYRKGTDFIQQYIFPGGMLPAKSEFRRQAGRQGLVVRDEFAFGLDYARTLALWREAFEAHWPRIAALGFDDSFRRFGFHVYDATLWAGDDPLWPPLALRLDYKRSIAGKAIAEASLKEVRKRVVDIAQIEAWGAAMARIFPDVRDGDHLIGLWQPEGARFLQGGRTLGDVDDPAFARAFFGIWLDEQTSAPGLRAALLQGPVS